MVYSIFYSKEVGLDVNAQETKLTHGLVPCVFTRLQDKTIINTTNKPFKNVAKLNIWDRHKHTRIIFTKKLKAEQMWGTLATVQFRIFGLTVSCLKSND